MLKRRESRLEAWRGSPGSITSSKAVSNEVKPVRLKKTGGNREQKPVRFCFNHNQPASAANRLHARHAPTDDGRFDRGAGLLVAPLAVNIEAGKGKFVSTAMIFAQNLDRLAGRG